MLAILPLLLAPTGWAFQNETFAETSQLHCPSADEAVSSCDPDTTFFRFQCCGDGLLLCCARIKHWVWFVGVAAIAIWLVFLICCCIRCFTGRNNRQSYNFS